METHSGGGPFHLADVGFQSIEKRGRWVFSVEVV